MVWFTLEDLKQLVVGLLLIAALAPLWVPIAYWQERHLARKAAEDNRLQRELRERVSRRNQRITAAIIGKR